ncbi:hypothetical protein V8D89_006470 [Ganoderma adspersum]
MLISSWGLWSQLLLGACSDNWHESAVTVLCPAVFLARKNTLPGASVLHEADEPRDRVLRHLPILLVRAAEWCPASPRTSTNSPQCFRFCTASIAWPPRQGSASPRSRHSTCLRQRVFLRGLVMTCTARRRGQPGARPYTTCPTHAFHVRFVTPRST